MSSTTTTNMGLTKPTPNTSEAYSVAVSNSNSDTIDGWAATAAPVPVDKTASAGDDSAFARRDHVHVRTARGGRVYRTATQSLNNTTATAILFPSGSSTESRDTDSFHDPSANTSRVTIPAGMTGIYLVSAGIGWAANATGLRICQIRVTYAAGGNELIAAASSPGAASIDIHMSASATYALTAGDYIEVEGFQSSGGALNVLGVVTTFLSCEYLGVSA